jgi:hypothetical protein
MIIVPEEGRPLKPTSASRLVGIDGNAFSVMYKTEDLLRKAGASPEYIDAYAKEAMSGDYNHLLQTSIAYLDPND